MGLKKARKDLMVFSVPVRHPKRIKFRPGGSVLCQFGGRKVTCVPVAWKERVCPVADTVPNKFTCGVAFVRVYENPL